MQVSMTKYHLAGLLEGRKTTETMRFTDWDRACDWAAKVTMNTQTSYVVLEMTNLETGEKEKF